MHNLPKIPLNVQFPQSPKMIKITEVPDGNAPINMQLGLFKRYYTTGKLELEQCVDSVLELIQLSKHKQPMTPNQYMILCVIFPEVWSDPTGQREYFREKILQITPEEVFLIKQLAAAKLAEALNYNAGRGGGSVPGRTSSVI